MRRGEEKENWRGRGDEGMSRIGLVW